MNIKPPVPNLKQQFIEDILELRRHAQFIDDSGTWPYDPSALETLNHNLRMAFLVHAHRRGIILSSHYWFFEEVIENVPQAILEQWARHTRQDRQATEAFLTKPSAFQLAILNETIAVRGNRRELIQLLTKTLRHLADHLATGIPLFQFDGCRFPERSLNS